MNLDKIRTKYFPIKLKNGYQIVISNRVEVYKTLEKHFFKIFKSGEAAPHYQLPKKRKKKAHALLDEFVKSHHEWFLFLDRNGKTIGWFMGEPENAVTFYMRNTGILPSHQNQGLYRVFMKALILYLKEVGYERITSHHKTTNRKILIAKLQAGFSICSLELTESFGPMVKMVKILHKDRQNYFIDHYGDQNHRHFYSNKE